MNGRLEEELTNLREAARDIEAAGSMEPRDETILLAAKQIKGMYDKLQEQQKEERVGDPEHNQTCKPLPLSGQKQAGGIRGGGRGERGGRRGGGEGGRGDGEGGGGRSAQ
eukprot:764780-Hanusia_phi.AAC.2